MNVKKTIKKIVALGAGASMVGATVMGATAAGLQDYPGMWMEDGQFDGKIVVGDEAATQDVLGAIDIAASLQAASTKKESVDVPGAAGKTTVEGDAVEIGTGSDQLGVNEPIGDVRNALTQYELDALKSGTISTDEGTTAYKQFLRFKTSNATELFPSAVVYENNDGDPEEVSDYLYVAEGQDPSQDAFFEWEIQFEEGLEAQIENGKLKDLEDEVFNIFGTDFVFVDSAITGPQGSMDLTIEFLAGDVTSSLQEGETKTFQVDGKSYEVTNVFVSNPSSGSTETQLSVNGELTDPLTEGDTDVLSDGTEIGVQDLLVSERGGITEFFLGAQKIQFQDGDTGNENFAPSSDSGGVDITRENIEEGFVRIDGQIIDGNNNSGTFEITNMKYRLTADPVGSASDLYVPPGHGIKEFLDEPEGMLSPDFDIKYEGFQDVGETPIEIDAQGDDEYELKATNIQGKEYKIPYVEIDNNNIFRFGEDGDEDLVFVEDNDFDSILNNGTDLSDSDFFIDQDDKFVISNNRDDQWDEQATSHVLEYNSIDASNNVITFEDLAGDSREFTYSDYGNASSNVNEVNSSFEGTGDLIVGGNAYKVYIANGSVDSNNPIAVDLDQDGVISGNKSRFTVKGGGIVEFDNTSTAPQNTSSGGGAVTNGPGSGAEFILHTESSEFDESSEGHEKLSMNVTNASTNEVTMDFLNYTRNGLSASSVASGNSTINRQDQVFIEGFGVRNTNGRYAGFAFSPSEPDEMQDHQLEMTDYGVSYDYYDPGANEPEELTLMYPHQQRAAQVFVQAGTYEATKGGPGGVTTTEVNPISVGLAVLDVNAPAVGSENMIAVGGSCINSVSAELIGVSYPTCGQEAGEALGIEEGKAKIKLYEDQNAILVGGYNAQDTLGASYALADYDSYDLTGDEVAVTVANLDSIQVSPVTGDSGSGNGDTGGNTTE